MDICCFSDGFLSFFTYVILTNVSNGANFCMKLPYFMKEISIFAPKPCILRNFRSKRERSGFSLLNLTALTFSPHFWGPSLIFLLNTKMRLSRKQRDRAISTKFLTQRVSAVSVVDFSQKLFYPHIWRPS